MAMEAGLSMLGGCEFEILLAVISSMGDLYWICAESNFLQVSWRECDDQWEGTS